MRDSFDNIDVTAEQTTTFIPEQWQTLAAFANAGLSLETMLAVADYNIIMLFLTKSESDLVGNNGMKTLCVNLSQPSTTFLKYASGDNLKTAKHRYAISTLAQNGSIAFSDSVSADHIVAGLLADPVYTNNGTSTSAPSASRLYGLIASLSVVTSQTHPIRSSYGNLIKPVQYALSVNDLKKRPRPVPTTTPTIAYITAHITLTILSDYSKLLSTAVQNMYYWKTVSDGIGQTAAEVAGTPFDPTTKQFITISSLQGQTAQEIYNSLNFTSSNTVPTANELAAFKLYGKTIANIRSVVDINGYGIPSYNNIENLYNAGYSLAEITSAFSGLGNGNYDFAVLIGVCSIERSDTTSNRLKYSPVKSGPYDFKYVDPTEIQSSVFVNRLRSIITTPDTDITIAMTDGGIASNLRAHILNCFKDFASATDKITDANSEPAVLRFLHTSAALGSEHATALNAFARFNGVSNVGNFMNLPYTLNASSSKLAPSAFLNIAEFAKFTGSNELEYEVGSSVYDKKVKSVIAAAASPKSTQYYVDSPSNITNLPNKKFYTLGSANKNYYNAASPAASAKLFDNGYSFADAYPHMLTSNASKIENIKTNNWPKSIVFTHTSMLLRDVCAYIMKKMNTSQTPLTDEALLSANSSYPEIWTSFTDLLVGTQKNNSIDNISYKTLLAAGAGAQYIKVDLAKNVDAVITAVGLSTLGDGTTIDSQRTSLFAGLGLPFADALYVARKVSSVPFTVLEIAKNKSFSRFERRKIFENVQQAAQQLDKDTFLGLVWPSSDLEANIKGQNPLNIHLVDLLSLTYEAKEADADGYLNCSAATRLAYHDAVVRKNMVKIFYPNLPEADVAVIAALNNKDEILDELSSRSLV